MGNSFYQFDMVEPTKSIIKVIGVGGGGSNAVSHMFSQGIKDVEFLVCNTDLQALNSTNIKHKIQIGTILTAGLGAGANPEVGKKAAEESKKEIRDALVENTKMVFITAGMGGGTGTGAAPVIARIARELDILTVGIVTAPFAFEGKKKVNSALKGIQEMKENCDTVIVINNERLRQIYGNLSLREAFAQADNILNTAAKSIAEVITVTSEINVDFEDVKTVMKGAGPAVMGSTVTNGEGRARRAIEGAMSSPLLENKSVKGVRKMLLSITYGPDNELTMDEFTEITDFIEEKSEEGTDVIFGQGLDMQLEDHVRVTVIATGFTDENLDENHEIKKNIIDSPTIPKTRVYDYDTGDSYLRKDAFNFEQDIVNTNHKPSISPNASFNEDQEKYEQPKEYPIEEPVENSSIDLEFDGSYEIEEIEPQRKPITSQLSEDESSRRGLRLPGGAGRPFGLLHHGYRGLEDARGVRGGLRRIRRGGRSGHRGCDVRLPGVP